MWSKKITKSNIFLLLMILFHLAKGESAAETLTSVKLPQEVNEVTVGENGIEATTIAGIEENDATKTLNRTESNNNDDSQTETATDFTTAATEEIECVCDCVANGSPFKMGCTTPKPEETQTKTQVNSVITITTPSIPGATNPTIENETTSNSEIEETTTQVTTEEDTTTSASDVSETTTALPVSCSLPGVEAHETDCQQYYECSLEGSQDGGLYLLPKTCPEKQVFNIELNRCSRDISSCSLPIQCLVKGGISDPATNSSYYLCEPRLIGLGYRIFLVDCSSNEIFYPEFGKCFIDVNNLDSQKFPPFNWNQIRDIDIVKAEMKFLKAQDKLKLKQEKAKQKAEEKLQKQLEKEAKKRAKVEAKQEAATFVCVQEGNFVSQIGGNTYIACVNKKGKLKALAMQCSSGTKFDSETNSCVNNPSNQNVSFSNDDDDEDDD